MAKLTSKARKALPASDFALSGRREPIQDKSHAHAALTMGMRKKTPNEKAQIRRAVKAKFPSVHVAVGSHKGRTL
jgi:hypothetical protein